MLIKCYGAAPQGIDAVIVTIEVHAVPGFEFTLVGLPDNAVKESHERIIAALSVNGYSKPRHTLTINMAPADIKKELEFHPVQTLQQVLELALVEA